MNRISLFTILILCSNIAAADSFRCGRKLVIVGDSSNTLTKKCGDPARKYSSKELIYDQGRQTRSGVSNWVFERRGKKDMIVSVRGGTVFRIRVE